MKILIIGSRGQVGTSLCRQAKGLGHQVIQISRSEWDMIKEPDLGEKIVTHLTPDLVINAAAYTDVENAEIDRLSACKVNVEAPKNLARACNHLNIPLFHISSDYVFGGEKIGPYSETDDPNPINYYGRTKLDGELAIKEETDNYIIVRTSSVFSKNGTNFVNKILKLANERNELMLVNDQFSGPTSADCIAKILLMLAKHHSHESGLYHYAGLPFVSWFEYAEYIISYASLYGLINKNPKLLISSDIRTSSANRPKNSRLKSDKILDLLNIAECEWKKELKTLLYQK